MMPGMRQSYSQQEKQRSTLYLETADEAAIRVAKRRRQELLGVRKKKRHSPPQNQLDFDKKNLLKEVKNMKEGDKVRLLAYISNSKVPHIYHIKYTGAHKSTCEF